MVRNTYSTEKITYKMCVFCKEGNTDTDLVITIKELKDAGAVIFDREVVNDNNLYISSRSTYELPIFINECLNVLRV